MKRALPFVALLALVVPAFADEGDEKSPAATAYEEGYFLETGTGALDKALEKYAAAVAAEGPPSVRARALYRSAVVLQRMGRADEAVKTLERLSNDFPAEREILAEAKKRLDEWTVVDLRTSFEEWYKRYRYSPDFQAKILDLVLKLGDDNARQAAANELLTIGDAAIPALKAHADSKNRLIRARSVALLLGLGEYPPVQSVLDTMFWPGSWTDDVAAWRVLSRAPDEYRKQLSAAVKGTESGMHLALRAVTEGGDSIYRAMASPDLGVNEVRTLLSLVDEAGSAETAARLESVAFAADTPSEKSAVILGRIVRSLPIERILEWPARAAEGAWVWNVVADNVASRVMSGKASFEGVMALLKDPERRERIATQLVARSPSHELVWTVPQLRALADAMTSSVARQRLRQMYVTYLNTRPDPGRPVVEAALVDPLAVPADLMRLNHLVREVVPAQAVAERMREAWPAWDTEQKIALLEGLVYGSGASGLPEVQESLRGLLHDPATDKRLRESALNLLVSANVLEVGDLKTLVNLGDPAEAARHKGMLKSFEADEAAYEAFAALARHPDPAVRFEFFSWAREGRSLVDRATAAMLADEAGWIRREAVTWLADRLSAADIPVFVKALEDPDTEARAAAATALKSVYDAAAVAALVKALDDPSVDVRTAALAALENIQKFEEQKEKWRKFAAEREK